MQHNVQLSEKRGSMFTAYTRSSANLPLIGSPRCKVMVLYERVKCDTVPTEVVQFTVYLLVISYEFLHAHYKPPQTMKSETQKHHHDTEK